MGVTASTDSHQIIIADNGRSHESISRNEFTRRYMEKLNYGSIFLGLSTHWKKTGPPAMWIITRKPPAVSLGQLETLH